MGFLDSLSGLLKGKKSDPIAELREKVEKNPKDPKLANELSMQLKARGDIDEAVHYAIVAATAHKDQGFSQKALAVLRAAETWGRPSGELLRFLADLHLELKHKEDARGVLIKLRQYHLNAGNKTELPGIDKQLAELGPGR